MAATCLGAIPSGVYTTDAASQLSFLVNNSKTKILVVENDEQLDKFLEVRDEMKGLKKVIVLESDGLRNFKDKQVMFLDDLYARGKSLAAKNPDQFAQTNSENQQR